MKVNNLKENIEDFMIVNIKDNPIIEALLIDTSKNSVCLDIGIALKDEENAVVLPVKENRQVVFECSQIVFECKDIVLEIHSNLKNFFIADVESIIIDKLNGKYKINTSNGDTFCLDNGLYIIEFLEELEF